MEEEGIGVLSDVSNVHGAVPILQKFVRQYENVFSFPNLAEGNRRVILWTALFQHIQNKASASIHSLCLSAVRVLSRDKTDLDALVCERWVTILIEDAGLYNFAGFEEESTINFDLPDRDIVMESLKCLCNLVFNSQVARAYCAQTCVAQGLVSRLRVYKDIPFKDDIMLFDMKLLFILTALHNNVKAKIKDELHGMDYLTSALNELLLEASVTNGMSTSSSAGEAAPQYYLNDKQQAIVCEVLKTQFNLVLNSGSEEHVEESEEPRYIQLMLIIPPLLSAQASREEKVMELRSNIANLLTGIPIPFYTYLTPTLNSGETARHVYEGKNMDAMHALVQLLQYRLNITSCTKNQYENLSPILTVLNKGSRGCREQRKYLRQVVLPPLRDVSRPPEKGATLRNQLCRLLTTPVSSVRDLVAEFLFILCKEKVGRMVKYTGFGNAAGHLAQKGLMGAERQRRAGYSSSSDDSDTEEYLQAQPNIDPVVGCTRPPRQDPFQGMTDEQKEYEAMKLVNLFDKMMSEGLMKPARLGKDGRPEPLEHVLQLRDLPPDLQNNSQSDQSGPPPQNQDQSCEQSDNMAENPAPKS